MHSTGLGNQDQSGYWLEDIGHRTWLRENAQRQFEFFAASLNPDGGFYLLGNDGSPLQQSVQELHTTTRLVHSYALGKMAGFSGCEAIVDQGMDYLWRSHRDLVHGGFLWAIDRGEIHDPRKLAYGHAFVLLAASSAKMAGHPDADRMLDEVSDILETRFWEEHAGLYLDEANRDWSPFSTYRGMNANMHMVEALLTAFEATGRDIYLDRAGSILDFFLAKMAPANDGRLPEHYDKDWQVDRDYSENPMFRPAGTTPGHSFELGRLQLQYWDLIGRPDDGSVARARYVVDTAFADAWNPDAGGLVYTLNFDGSPAIRARYWWPVTEAIGVVASFLKLSPNRQDEDWYRTLWQFASHSFVDQENGGWFPEIDETGKPSNSQFIGKPDVYHSVQAALFPLSSGLSRLAKGLGPK